MVHTNKFLIKSIKNFLKKQGLSIYEFTAGEIKDFEQMEKLNNSELTFIYEQCFEENLI